MIFKPHDYQERAIEFILNHENSALFLDMGLGKTVITLTALYSMLFDRFTATKVLVIAPLTVAWNTWSLEAEKWEHLQGLKISKVLGTAAERRKALQEDAEIYVINRENVVWLVKELKTWPFDVVVIDELSSFKSNQSKRFKALKYVRPYIDHVIGLTGTPASNSMMDLWAEMYLVDQGKRLGKTLTQYRSNYFKPGWSNGYVVYKWQLLPGAKDIITEKLSDISVSMSAQDYLSLPDRVETDIFIDLDSKTLKAYQQLEREALTTVDDTEIEGINAAAIMSKLLQASNGFLYDEAHAVHRLHSAKLEALEELIEQAQSPVLVFYEFKADLEDLAKLKGARQLSGPKDIEDWNAGKINILLAHPASAGYGLNLQEGGHIIVWYGLTWSLEQYQQANARLYRQGQKDTVFIYHILAKETADEDVKKALEDKDMSQSALLNALKERRDRL